MQVSQQRQADRALEETTRRASPSWRRRSATVASHQARCTQHAARCDLGGDVSTGGLRDSLEGSGSGLGSPRSMEMRPPETGGRVLGPSPRPVRRNEPRHGGWSSRPRSLSPRLARTAYPFGPPAGRTPPWPTSARSSPGSSAATAAKYASPSEGRPSAMCSTPRHYVARRRLLGLGRLQLPRGLIVRTVLDRRLRNVEAQLRGSRGRRHKGLALVGPDERQGGQHTRRRVVGIDRRNGEELPRESRATAPNSALNSALGAVAGRAAVCRPIWRRTPISCSTISRPIGSASWISLCRLEQEPVERLVALELGTSWTGGSEVA